MNLNSAGRLDADSEGLLLLTNDKPLVSDLLGLPKTYWVQVEGVASEADLRSLRSGVPITIKKTHFITDECAARALEPPIISNEYVSDSGFESPRANISRELLWAETHVRKRLNVPTQWLEVVIREGRNRQVRRMCASVGLPCLRLVRVQIGALSIFRYGNDKLLKPGEYVSVTRQDIM
jgi:23S rRNA pseudouridine2457 synthase